MGKIVDTQPITDAMKLQLHIVALKCKEHVLEREARINREQQEQERLKSAFQLAITECAHIGRARLVLLDITNIVTSHQSVLADVVHDLQESNDELVKTNKTLQESNDELTKNNKTLQQTNDNFHELVNQAVPFVTKILVKQHKREYKKMMFNNYNTNSRYNMMTSIYYNRY